MFNFTQWLIPLHHLFPVREGKKERWYHSGPQLGDSHHLNKRYWTKGGGLKNRDLCLQAFFKKHCFFPTLLFHFLFYVFLKKRSVWVGSIFLILLKPNLKAIQSKWIEPMFARVSHKIENIWQILSPKDRRATIDRIDYNLRGGILYRKNFRIRLVPCDLSFQRGAPSHRVVKPRFWARDLPLINSSPLLTLLSPLLLLLTGVSPPARAVRGLRPPLPHHAHSAFTNLHWKIQNCAKARSCQATVNGSWRCIRPVFLIEKVFVGIIWKWMKQPSEWEGLYCNHTLSWPLNALWNWTRKGMKVLKESFQKNCFSLELSCSFEGTVFELRLCLNRPSLACTTCTFACLEGVSSRT